MAILRLDPFHPPLWRDSRTLQLGLDGTIRIDDPDLWQQQLIARLVEGVDEDGLEAVGRGLRTDAASVRAFLSDLSPVLRRDTPPLPARILAADGVDAAVVALVRDALSASGWEPAWVSASTPAKADIPCVLIAHHLLPPALWAPLMREDVRHVPIVFSDEHAVVGPAVAPGAGACLSCVAAHERERDPAWPALATQLLSRPPAPVAATLGVAAGRLAATMLAELTAATGRDGEPAWAGESSGEAVLSADGRLRWRSRRPHADCLCRSPRENGRARAAGVPTPIRAATTARATALRA
jgi:hypothetical protein